MGRKLIRTHQLTLRTSSKLITLFGTMSNAYYRLGLGPNDGMSYSSFYRAMSGKLVTKQHLEVIKNAWNTWQVTFLRVGADDAFVI